MIYYYTLFSLFAIVVTMMIIDQNVSTYIFLLSKSAKLNIERLFWMMRFHPVVQNNFISRWIMYRKYLKISKDLENEINQNK